MSDSTTLNKKDNSPPEAAPEDAPADAPVKEAHETPVVPAAEASGGAGPVKHSEPPLLRQGSEVSLGFSDVIPDIDQSTLVIREGPESYKNILRGACAFAIRCPHGRMPLQKLKDHVGYWLPYIYVPENTKYIDTVFTLYDFFAEESKSAEGKSISSKRLNASNVNKFLTNIELNNIYRFQLPDGQFVSRHIFIALWAVGNAKIDPIYIPCCKESPNVMWAPIQAILHVNASRASAGKTDVMDRIWGYEVIKYAIILNSSKDSKSHGTPTIRELTGHEVMKYLHASARANPTKQALSDLLACAKYSEKNVVKIYCDYVQHCFPSMSMTFCSFSEYFSKIGLTQFDETVLRRIFLTINYQRSNLSKAKNFILFHEFLFGLAALEANTPNCQLRCMYIFRYYSQRDDLNETEFQQMVSDIRDKLKPINRAKDLNEEVEASVRAKLMGDTNKVNCATFLKETCLPTGCFKITTHLFRSNKSIMNIINNRLAYEYITHRSGKPFDLLLASTCSRCGPKKYTLGYNLVRLSAQGRIEDPKPLVEMNAGNLDANLQFKKRTHPLKLKHSIEVVFNKDSAPNKVLSIIRKMSDFNKMSRDRQKEVAKQVNDALTFDLLKQLCKDMNELTRTEPPVLKLNSPIFVLGDTHGNINDVLTYEEQLWPMAPVVNAPNFVFLGDYVDRGDYSIEVVAYLFAMKILAPDKFYLLRGNHEIRAIQRNFTFARECSLKYKTQSFELFEIMNQVFDALPLVGIIDESIFCSHGGIPFCVNKIEDLYKIPSPMPDPEHQSKAAWEVLWSDPITEEEYKQVCEFRNQSTDSGYTDNLRRSTAYYFTEKALRKFLKANGLSHVIRGHELEMDGYRFHHSGLLLTVFSSSRYCNSCNKSAAVFIDNRDNEGFIKVVSLET